MPVREKKLTAGEIVDWSKEYTFFSWSVQTCGRARTMAPILRVA